MTRESDIVGRIFDIKRFAIHDGPGTRTTLFLKGCSLRCAWCHNPESFSRAKQLMFVEHKCIHCGACFAACPEGALTLSSDGARRYEVDRCTRCGRCVEACCAAALTMQGRDVTVSEAVYELSKDKPFYETSGGGVTLSGGEPMLQAEFSSAVLEACRNEGMHTALDTSGIALWSAYEAILPHVDLFLWDFKHPRSEEHEKYTGVSNDRILENLRRLCGQGASIEIRIPLIAGINDGESDIEATASILRDLDGITHVEVLSYHALGESKYRQLGIPPSVVGLSAPSPQRLTRAREILSRAGLEVHVTG